MQDLYAAAVADPVLRDQVFDLIVEDPYDALSAGFSKLSVVGSFCSSEIELARG